IGAKHHHPLRLRKGGKAGSKPSAGLWFRPQLQRSGIRADLAASVSLKFAIERHIGLDAKRRKRGRVGLIGWPDDKALDVCNGSPGSGFLGAAPPERRV